MVKRPLVLTLFASFLCLDPIIRVFIISAEQGFSILEVIQKTFSLGALDIFNFWFLFPLSGVLLLYINTISLLIFVLIQVYSIYHHLNYTSYSWPFLSKSPSITSYILLVIDSFVTIYLLLPANRRVFLNKEMRRWERGSRFICKLPAKWGDASNQTGDIVDVAFGGCLLRTSNNLDLNDQIHLSFYFLNESIEIDGTVVRIAQEAEDDNRYGVQFEFSNLFSKYLFRLRIFLLSMRRNVIKYR